MSDVSQPNILFIFTDQQSATMMSCAGNEYLDTPAMDSLAATGVQFERAYCSNPVCMPSRFSLMTGRMPSEIDLRDNGASHIDSVPERILTTGMGHLLREAGYETAYGGKVHLPKMTPVDIGFDVIRADQRDGLAEACAEYVARDHEKPFLLVASFINPHDICYMAIRDFVGNEREQRLVDGGKTPLMALDEALQMPEGMSEEEFFERVCPPLPDNFEVQQDEPEAIGMFQADRPFKKSAREQWSEERWRLHRWAYCRLTERVDRQVGVVLDALRNSGKERDTRVVFSSDHGDMDSAHRMEHKTAFYEEACRVPLIVSQPGVTPAGTVNASHLVSNGLDLLPTFCDYAGIDPPEELKGMSIRALAEGRPPASWRTSLPIENECGRMAVTQRYKYMLYDEGANREQLIDLCEDPGEMRNAVADPACAGTLEEHRGLFRSHFDDSG